MSSEEIEIVAIIFDHRNVVISGAKHKVGTGKLAFVLVYFAIIALKMCIHVCPRSSRVLI